MKQNTASINTWNIIIKLAKLQNPVKHHDDIRCSEKVSTFPYGVYIALR
jgi:hypothetical protein